MLHNDATGHIVQPKGTEITKTETMTKKRILTCLTAMLMVALSAHEARGQRNVNFDDFFSDATMRVDYKRIGCKKHDTCILQQFAVQNNMWAGSTTQLIDPIDNGMYRLMVRDAATHQVLYTRCYNTLFEEYRETIAGRDKDSVAEFEEVMLFPMPQKAVDVCLQKRDEQNRFATASTFRFDPKERNFQRLEPRAEPIHLHENGHPHHKIDVAIVAEGYGPQDHDKMMDDFKKFTEYLLAQEPFRGRANDFNVWGIDVLGKESGVTDPGKGRYVQSAVMSSYNTFNMDRYLMTTHLFTLHDLLAGCPYDHILIMANCDTYGGGAIYNYYAFSAVQEMSMWILPHELGHSIGGLADEYVEDDPNYNQRYTDREPLEPNITSLKSFETKWADIVLPGTPIPTEPVKGLDRRENGPVGAYEGAGYLEKGVYRPCTKCMMRDYAEFCPVCTKRMHQVFDLYVR